MSFSPTLKLTEKSYLSVFSEMIKFKDMAVPVVQTEPDSLFEAKKARVRGFIFACTEKSERELLSMMVVATGKNYANKLFSVKKKDYVFLYNLDTDTLYGVFTPESEPIFDRNVSFFDGKYPYYMHIKPIGSVHSLNNVSRVFKRFNFSWKDVLTKYGTLLLKSLLEGKTVSRVKVEKIVDSKYIPPIFSTTLWDFPYQSYGDTQKGSNKYPGVTPAFIIYNLIWRYTDPGDLVCDPMAGSGTTIDVCLEERRRVVAFDIIPTRKDIIQADARALPLKDNSVDMIFIDSPYGDNIAYNNHPLNIGHIPATSERFYDELEKVMRECSRVLKEDKILAWLIGDQWAKGSFVPVGLNVYERLIKYFQPVDIVCVVRRNQASNTPFWHSKAIQNNFYLRGFKYLIIVKKSKNHKGIENMRIKWSFYER